MNPLGDLYKTQVWGLARHLGVPQAVVEKVPTADLIPGQTDEGDLGVRYLRADVILEHYLKGYPDAYIESLGYTQEEIGRVKERVNRTHWKRALPTVALLSSTAIGEDHHLGGMGTEGLEALRQAGQVLLNPGLLRTKLQDGVPDHGSSLHPHEP